MVAHASRFIFERAGVSQLKPCRVLDAGCGSGEVAMLFKKIYPKPTHKIWGVTLSPEQYYHGRQILEKQSVSEINLSVGDFHALPFEKDYFDHVLFINSICYSHGSGKFQALKEASRVLKKGGKIAFYDVVLSKPESAFPAWWRFCNKILLATWKVPEWSEESSLAQSLKTLGFSRIYEKDFRFAIIPSVLSMALVHLPWFFWQALCQKISWHETGVLLKLIFTAPLIGVHPDFHHPVIIWEKN